MKTQKLVNKLVQIPSDMNEQLKRLKNQEGISQGHIIREGISIALKKYASLLARH